MAVVEKQGQTIKLLEKRIVELEAEIYQLKNHKNSQNSSIAPSKDENRPLKNQSLKVKTGKKSGGQQGHKGKTLQMSATPQKVITHSPQFCTDCGSDLALAEAQLIGKRQIVDLPPIQPVFIEHQCFSKTCLCGKTTSANFPSHLRSPIQYGPNVESLIAYLSVRQYLPYQRMTEFLEDVCGLKISQGSICNLLDQFKNKASIVAHHIKDQLREAAAVGTDETGAKVNGKKHWIWTWQNKHYTHIALSANRGINTIKTIFPEGLPKAVLTHDRWAAHFHCQSKTHQICIAHLLRELNYLDELYDNIWSKQMKSLLMEGILLKKNLAGKDYSSPVEERNLLESKLANLLSIPIDEKHKQLLTFQKQIAKLQDYIFPFLYYDLVQPDNNASERAIRNVKVKQKISGQFKSLNGAYCFATIRSVIDTFAKQNLNILNSLKLIAQFRPE